MDIDIDLRTDFDPRTIMKQAIPASMVKNDELSKHPCGHYLQTMPVDSHTGLAAIPHKEAEQFGFFKFDFLHLSVLDHFSSKQEIRKLINEEPDWDLLLDEEQVAKLFQISKHPDLIAKLKPRSIVELADAIALVRPGKRHLIPAYIRGDKKSAKAELYTKTEDSYSYKRGHAISYALTIILQLHLIAQGKL